MEFFDDVAKIPADFGPSVVTIGKFDGVHLGHRAVLDAVRAAGEAEGLVSTAVTFDRHPLSLFAPEKCPVVTRALAWLNLSTRTASGPVRPPSSLV